MSQSRSDVIFKHSELAKICLFLLSDNLSSSSRNELWGSYVPLERVFLALCYVQHSYSYSSAFSEIWTFKRSPFYCETGENGLTPSLGHYTA